MKTDSAQKTSVLWLFLALAVVFAVWAGSGWWLHGDDQRGTFGDMFGAVNALFSGLAFATLIFTVWLQREELTLQRHELKLTRQELSGQREQMASQAATLKLQQFESTFFQLIRVHGEIVNAMDLVRAGNVTKGRDCFKVFVGRLYRKFEVPTTSALDDERKRIRKAYEDFYQDNEAEVGHYFRHLYHIVKFVKSGNVDADGNRVHLIDERRYTAFIRAQLSSYELVLLFYNCLSEYGEQNFRPLVEEYGLLKHLPQDLYRPIHKDLYLESAFLPSSVVVVRD